MVSTTQPINSSPWHYISPRNTRPPENRANNNYNYILNNLANGLAEESDNEDGKNIVDKGKAKNYSNGSDNSNNTDNNNSRDSNSSDSNKGNKAYRYIGRQELLTPITS